ncbi:MAG TPA: mechanosensitive ion channel domain-containing protein [Azospirillaceae bacterium]|nr:mechanosensitive ion channel domain-containing protein [Azospirillaceae bacterium]
MPNRLIRAALFALALLCPALFPVASVAQQAAQPARPAQIKVPPGVESDQLRALASTLEDDAARERLLQRIRTMLAVMEEPGAEPAEEEAELEGLGSKTLEMVSSRVRAAGNQLIAIGMVVGDVPSALVWLHRQVNDPALRDRWAQLFLQLAMIVAAGFAAERSVGWLVRRPRRAMETRTFDRWLPKLPFLLARTLLDLLPIAAFAVVAYGIISISQPQLRVRIVALTVVNATIIIHAVLALSRFLLSPQAGNLRLFQLSDEAANYLYIWVRRLAYTCVYGYFIPEAAYVLGLPTGTYRGLLKFTGLLVGAMLVIIVLQNRRHVCEWIRGDGACKPNAKPGRKARTGAAVSAGSATMQAFRRRLAEVWHLLAIAYIIVIYGIWALEVKGGFAFMLRATALSVVIVVAARLVVMGADKAIQRGFAIPADVKARLPRLEERANRYLPWLRRGVRWLVLFVATMTLLDVWGVKSFAWLETPWGRQFATRVMTIGLIIGGALVVWEVVSGLIERYLSGSTRDGRRVERSARMRTLLPLVRNALMIVLVTFASLIVLSELGVNIAPLLAGAGVIGLAIGFGSQTLVKDVITGLFILIEDTIAVGDVVDVGGGHSGVVEALSIRAIRLRDVRGGVHTIPFSEVRTVLNMTKEFSYAVIDASVDYGSDIDRVAEVLKGVGNELQSDPAFAGSVVEPIEILGIDRFEESAVVVRGRIKTRPGKQWAVGREFNRRMKQAFDAVGISIPFPQRTVHVKGDVSNVRPEQVAAAMTSD